MIRADQALAIARHVFDPRGRCDRRAMVSVTLGVVAAQLLLALLFTLLGASTSSTAFLIANLPLMWAGTAVLLKRLHDVGWSGWWIGPAVLFWLVGSVLILLAIMLAVGMDRFAAALQTYPALHAALVVAVAIPPFGGLLWLQASAGTPGPNRFGRAPFEFGFAPGLSAVGHADDLPAGAVSA